MAIESKYWLTFSDGMNILLRTSPMEKREERKKERWLTVPSVLPESIHI
jgi:hypothetical protein